MRECLLMRGDREPCLFINSYHPLVRTPDGREAAVNLGIPPFVDGSIRREPDLQHPFPSISCICRGGNFAPRLRPGDPVVYLTVTAKYGDPHRQPPLTVLPRVTESSPTHASAAVW